MKHCLPLQNLRVGQGPLHDDAAIGDDGHLVGEVGDVYCDARRMHRDDLCQPAQEPCAPCQHSLPIEAHHGLVEQPVLRSEEHTSELQSLMRISYAVFCLNKKIIKSEFNDNASQQE